MIIYNSNSIGIAQSIVGVNGDKTNVHLQPKGKITVPANYTLDLSQPNPGILVLDATPTVDTNAVIADSPATPKKGK